MSAGETESVQWPAKKKKKVEESLSVPVKAGGKHDSDFL